MGQVSPYLRKMQCGYGHYCPGCKSIHVIYTPRWSFDGNVEKPTFSPSIRIFTRADDGIPEVTECHYHIRNGVIEFCGDSAHELKGQNVPLPELPPEYSDDKYGWPP